MIRVSITRFLVVALIAAQPFGASAQEPSVPTLHASAQLVLLDASVDNKRSGTPIGDLTPSDFSLTEGGVEQPITYLSRNELPLSVVFLFDVTDTVRPVLKPLAAGAGEVLSHLKPNDEVAIMAFSSRATLLQDFTTDRALAVQAVARAADIKDREATFIHEDMFEAIDQALRSTIPRSRRVLVWFTDGTANYPNPLVQQRLGRNAPARLHDKAEATDKLAHSDVVVSALIDRSAMTDASILLVGITSYGDVERYAAMTGGPVLHTSRKDVALRLAALLDEIRQRYTLGYRPTQTRPPGTYCPLKLQLSPAFFSRHPELKKRDLVIRTKQGYFR